MRKSKSLHLILRGAGWCCITIVVLIGIFILLKSYPFIQQMGISVLWQDERWAPTQGLYNLVPIFVGSILVTMGAVLVAGPIGVLLAIFGRFYAPAWVAKVYRGLIELLAGIPSVVYGFWGLVVLVPIINNIAPPGASLLAGVIVLAVMILPIVVLAADTAFEQVPEKWMIAADALALQTWSKVYVIALPHATPAILSGVIMQSTRALGETMAVLMVTGNIVQIPLSIFEPMRTLTANIALEMAYATDMHSHALFVSALLLFTLTFFLVYLKNKVAGLRYE